MSRKPSEPGPLASFGLTIAIPVRWGDMDAFAHVNNTRYFQFFESARIAYFDRMPIDGPVGPILAEASCRFRWPITYPDILDVGARVTDIAHDRFRMTYLATSRTHDRVAATGDAWVVAYDYEQKVKALLPTAWREAFVRIEAGEQGPRS